MKREDVKLEDLKLEASHFVGDPLKWARWLGAVGSFRQNELARGRGRLAVLRRWRGFRVAWDVFWWLRFERPTLNIEHRTSKDRRLRGRERCRWRNRSYAPLGLGIGRHWNPTACAVGYRLAPRWGWGSRRGNVQLPTAKVQRPKKREGRVGVG